jgi:hypothetical protein
LVLFAFLQGLLLIDVYSNHWAERSRSAILTRPYVNVQCLSFCTRLA